MNDVMRLAAARAPSGLEDFRIMHSAIEESELCYRIACECGAASGRVVSYYDADERFWMDPLVFECLGCNFSAAFFDSRRDGYNAVLNDFSPYPAREEGEPISCGSCGSTEHTLVGLYRYDFDDEEVEQEWTEEERSQMHDLFSSAQFRLTCSKCAEEQRLGDYECA